MDAQRTCRANLFSPPSEGRPDQKLLQAVVRAHVWLTDQKAAATHQLKN